ncbi:hypothetical protein FRC08_011308 [Ceratobasidium sp. 394]|nr:hypothetical protein FRC08_011308 [Ceratobasidium sp. 394]
MKHLRDWTPVPPLPRPRITSYFGAKVRPCRVPPPLTRDDEEVIIVAHILPPLPLSPESKGEDGEIIITRHVLPPEARRAVPPPAPPPEPKPLLACASCQRPVRVGWRLPCGHAIDDRCYFETVGEPADDDFSLRPLPVSLDGCPARGCMEEYFSELVRIDGRWYWQPQKETRRYRAC